jgi:membrane-bound serine protease (ClpP class)
MTHRFPAISAALLFSLAATFAALKPGDNPKSPEPAAPAANTAPAGGPVYVFPFKDVVGPANLAFLRRSLKEAERAGASAFIIDMDTPGGRVDVTLEIFELMRLTKVPTITFVNPNALSAGALISLSTPKIYMRPDATIGAAAVVGGEGEDIQKTMKSKIDSVMGAKMRDVCERNGHNYEIAEAFMILGKELKVGDALINSKDTLLTLTGREAAKLYDGKPLLAAGLAENIDGVLKLEGLTGPVVRITATGFEKFAFWITMIAPILLMGGIIGAYIEMKTPGFGIPGIASLICFGLFFGGHLVAGLAGWEVVIVFVIGVVLVLFEFFAAPGTFLPGVIGTFLILGSVVWAMVDRWPSQTGLPSGDALQQPLFNLLVASGGAAVLAAVLMKFLPKTSFYRRLVLGASSASGPAITVPTVNLELHAGDIGVAATTLRPSGKATFRGDPYDVVTGGDFITQGTSVKVISVDGMRVIVEPVN